MARIYASENRADLFLLFIRRVKLFGICRCALRANPCEDSFVVRAASLAAESINSGANSDAIEPCVHIFVMSFRIAPQFQKNFHGEFFGAATIADDALNDAGDSRIVGAKERFDVEWRGGGAHVGDSFSGCVHGRYNAARKKIMTAHIETLKRADCTSRGLATPQEKGVRRRIGLLAERFGGKSQCPQLTESNGDMGVGERPTNGTADALFIVSA